MHKLLPLALLALIFRIAYADELLDDFERGESKNLRNGYWYYFADVKDGGNSEILNAEMLSLGNYSAPKPVKEGSDSGYCLKLEYMLGDIMPMVEEEIPGETEHCNFTGIGTDIARAGSVTDIRPAYGVSFRARSHDSIIVFFELVTSNIYDYGYYRNYFWVTDSWQTFSIDFNDTNQFLFPDNDFAYDPEDHQLLLTKIQKMNWQVAACFSCIESWNLPEDIGEYNHTGSGVLYLDDIIILDSSKVRANKYTQMRLKQEPEMSIVFGDLLGRRVVSESFKLAPGIYLTPERKNMKIDYNRYLK